MRPSVTAAMIVRNEAAMLEGCLSSLATHVDEIVIVDTGSDDGSREIALAGGARVMEIPWPDDFSAARNAGLEACRTDWILYIDADERLSMRSGEVLMDSVDPRWIGAWVAFRPKSGFTQYLDPRLHRRHPRLRFTGRIHETLYHDMLSLSREDGSAIGRSEAAIEHFGYDGDQSHKHLRNLPLLEKAVVEQPGRVYLWHHLAETLDSIGRHDGATAAARAGIAAASDADDEKTRQDASLIYQLLARSMLRRGLDPIQILSEAAERVSCDHALTYLMAERHLAMGDPASALAAAESLLAIDPAHLPLCFLAFDERIFGVGARGIKARALLDLGCPGEALDALRSGQQARARTVRASACAAVP